MINLLQKLSVVTKGFDSMPSLEDIALAAVKNRVFSVTGSYTPNSLGLECFSGTFSLDTTTSLISSDSRVTERELNNTNIKIYSNKGDLVGIAQSGRSFVDPLKRWFGLAFDVETTTLGLGIGSVRLLFEYPANINFVSVPTSSTDTLQDGYFSAAWSRSLKTQVIVPVKKAAITS